VIYEFNTDEVAQNIARLLKLGYDLKTTILLTILNYQPFAEALLVGMNLADYKLEAYAQGDYCKQK
jgi:hypothetical protein